MAKINNNLDIQFNLGRRIQFLRLQKKLTQEELAYNCAINKNYLSDLERGTRNPSLAILLRICDGLDISLEELFKGIEDDIN
jgi:transcriptional regulator with XRE-family HTH domain